MRKKFEKQLILGRILIKDTEIPTAKRSGALPQLCAALKDIYITPEWNKRVHATLEASILSGKKETGRLGMNLWHIFVMSQVRMCQNISYDELHDLVNHHTLIRQIMGIESGFGYEKIKFGYQTIIDNVSLLTDDVVKELNTIIVEFGHGVFKKKEEEALHLKTDSFVVESNVHFPTDYNLLWDCARKSIDMVNKLQEKHNLKGWRKIKNWRKDLKNKMRALGRANASGGKGKQERLTKAVRSYLTKAEALLIKLKDYKDDLPEEDAVDMVIVIELERFMQLLEKHIDLVKRRLLQNEKIPHSEKMFSIFEDYTEWVTKGKMRPNVELGKKVSVTSDQHHLIVDYLIMDHQSDSEIVSEVATRLAKEYTIDSWTFDKGYWHKDNKEFLNTCVKKVVMPKKGKCNNVEKEEEATPIFKKLRNKHSAIESNINELEHRGLNRCPDKGFHNFKRYVGLAVCAFNLRKIGAQLVKQQVQNHSIQSAA